LSIYGDTTNVTQPVQNVYDREDWDTLLGWISSGVFPRPSQLLRQTAKAAQQVTRKKRPDDAPSTQRTMPMTKAMFGTSIKNRVDETGGLTSNSTYTAAIQALKRRARGLYPACYSWSAKASNSAANAIIIVA